MSFSKESAVTRAKTDLAERLGIDASSVKLLSAEDKDFPNSSLGAPVDDEMSAQMISSGWKIMLDANGKNYEYRADKYQLRLLNFKGANIIVTS
ncbi:MAG TPA: hypothetical protein VGO50_05850 [Pyrinomonadaceae bacterium]|jgi:hypothetical protein|nr:hypothetical protein [Pyrinomonadaceae bacterium]